jgi:predicted  nucleic acid-binding Zn-ribbon protein
MGNVPMEFDEGDRPQLDLLRSSLEDAEDQLRRANVRLDRAQRRVRNLEVAVQSWKALVSQYEQALDPGNGRRQVDVTL